MANRMYDPRNGRFLSRDPLGTGGGPNLYGFTANDPVNRVDPLGLELIPIVIGYKTECEGGEVRPDGTMTPFVCRPTEPLFTFIDVPDSGGGFGGGSGGLTGGGGGGGDTGGGSTGGGPNQPPPPPQPPRDQTKEATDNRPKTDCETLVENLVANVTMTPSLARMHRTSRASAQYAVGMHMVAQAYGSGTTNRLIGITKAPRFSEMGYPVPITGFRPELVSGGQDSDVLHHVWGHAGGIYSNSLEGASISAIRFQADLEQLADPEQSAHDDETRAEIAGDIAGRQAGELMKDTLDGYRSTANLELIRLLCK